MPLFSFAIQNSLMLEYFRVTYVSSNIAPVLVDVKQGPASLCSKVRSFYEINNIEADQSASFTKLIVYQQQGVFTSEYI